jgi:hypothetical protein
MDLLRRVSRTRTKNKNARLAPLALWMAVFVAPAWAQDNSRVVGFARVNADKFMQEIAPGSIQVGSVVSVRGRFDAIDFSGLVSLINSPYDASTQRLRFNGPLAHVSSLQISQTCRGTGSFVGQNAFGAKTTVRREACERFLVSDVRVLGVNIDSATMNVSPVEFAPAHQG